MSTATGWSKRLCSVRSVASTVVFVVALFAYVLWHTNFLVGRSLMLAFPEVESTYKSAWPTFNGAMVASDVTVNLPFYDDDAYLTFEHVRIEMPFAAWVQSLFTKKTRKVAAAIDEITLVFDGAKSPGDYGYASALFAFGDASGAPFEALGCVNDDYWVRHELLAMGLTPGPTRLSMGWRNETGQVVKELAIATPGVGRVSLTRTLSSQGSNQLLSDHELGTLALVTDRWNVVDEGFVKARNRYCAEKDGVSESLFVGRHLAAVGRVLASEGLSADPAVTELYREYAENGGHLTLSVNYRPAISGVQYDGLIGGWAPNVDGMLIRGDKFAELNPKRIAEQPFTDEDDGLTVFETMVMEGSLPQELVQLAQASVPPPGFAPSANARVESSPESPGVRRGATAPAAVGAVADSSAASQQLTNEIRNVPWERSATSRDRSSPGLANLNDFRGRWLKVYLRNQQPRIMQILKVERGSVHVLRRIGRGWASYAFAQDRFVRAEPLR